MHLFQPVILPVGQLVRLVLAGDDHLDDDDDDGDDGCGEEDGGAGVADCPAVSLDLCIYTPPTQQTNIQT